MLALERLIHVKQDCERTIFEVVSDRLPVLPAGSMVVILLSTAAPESSELRLLVERLERRRLRSAFVLIDGETFHQLDFATESEDERERRREAALELLAGAGIPAAVLTAADEPEQRLGDGLFET